MAFKLSPVKIEITTEYRETKLPGGNFILGKINGKLSAYLTKNILIEAKKLASGDTIPAITPGQQNIKNPSTLADGIKSSLIGKEGNKVHSEVISTAPHSSAVEYGTGEHGEKMPPHRIYPTHAPAMVFEIDGKTIYATSTAGQYPKPFMRGSIFKVKAKMPALLKTFVDVEIKEGVKFV